MPGTRTSTLLAELVASPYLSCYNNTVFAEAFAERYLMAYAASGLFADEFLGNLPHHLFPGE